MKYPSWQEIKAAQEEYNRMMSPEVITNQQATQKCECSLKLNECKWIGQCDRDIERYKRFKQPIITNTRTNQQATDNHTMGMVNKMTRNEAIEKLILNNNHYAVEIVSALEALGLIKFDEEKNWFDILKAHCDDPNDLIRELHINGFCIGPK